MATLYVTEQKSIIRKTSDRLIVEKNKEVAGQGQGRSGVLRMQRFACRPFGAGDGVNVRSLGFHPRLHSVAASRLNPGITLTVSGRGSRTPSSAGNRSHRLRLF